MSRHAIKRYQDVATRLGHELAERYGFAYPEELEAVTRREWRAFRAGMSDSTTDG